MKLALLCILLLVRSSAYAIEKMDCLGTEPFWDATLTDGQVVLEISTKATKRYPTPIYRPAAGTNPDYVMSLQARNRTSNITAFVVKEACSDDMSDRVYPFSIYLMVDGKPYRGCCSKASNSPIEQN
jgi:uncharacterized membrane protein